MAENSFVLTPGRHVGAADQEEDDEPFAWKMARLVVQLRKQQAEGGRHCRQPGQAGLG